MSGRGIKELPKGISLLAKLERLDLNTNKLKDLHFELSKLDELVTLYLEGNDFENIPKVLEGEFKSLKQLYIGSNKITVISIKLKPILSPPYPNHFKWVN